MSRVSGWSTLPDVCYPMTAQHFHCSTAIPSRAVRPQGKLIEEQYPKLNSPNIFQPKKNIWCLFSSHPHIPLASFLCLPGGSGENTSGTNSASRAAPVQLRESGGWGNVSVPTFPPSTWMDSGATSSPGTGPTHTSAPTGRKAKAEGHQNDAARFHNVFPWPFCQHNGQMCRRLSYFK